MSDDQNDKNPNPEEMTMASEAGQQQPKAKANDEDFGEQGTMASESGNLSAPIQAPRPPVSDPTAPAPVAPSPLQQTMASMPGTSSVTGAGHKPTGKADFTAESLIGTELNSYKVLKKIAEGGMGVVLLGEHTLIGRRGAIKVLKPEFCQDESVVQRFYQEARAVNTIQHENIVDVYDFGRMDNGGVYFIMEFLEGEPLSGKVAKGPLTFAESLPILEQTLRALKAAHDKGFIHRDLKPDNLFLVKRDGTPHVKILDFGIAKLAGLESAQEKLTRTGSIIGTPHYMSPEQIEGSEVDLRTDIYAMGVIMYELWTGDTPFKGETLGQVIKGHLMIQAPRLENLKPDLRIPGRAAEIVAKALEKDREKRYSSAAELLADLQAAAKLPFTPIEARAHTEEKKATAAKPQTQIQPIRHQAPEAVAIDTTLAPPPPPKNSYTIPAVLGLGAAAALGAFFLWPKDSGQSNNRLINNNNNAAIVGKEPGCGNKNVEEKEGCDDGNVNSGDGCSSACATEEGFTCTGAPSVCVAEAKDCPEDLDKCGWPKLRSDNWAMLRNSINEADPRVRTLGIGALGDLKDTESSTALLEKVQNDPDEEAKAQAAKALGQIGDVSALTKLQEMSKTATGPLQTWLFGSAAQLGDKAAAKALEKILTDAMSRINAAIKANKPASNIDIAIALEAGLGLADLAKPGEVKVVALLAKLAALEATLVSYSPTAGALIVGKMAKLGDKTARTSLEGFLSNEDESIRLIAAEQLANLGDDTGKAVLTTALTSAEPANQLIAARILVTLGDYSGYDVLLDGLNRGKDPELQQIAVEGLAKIGERDSLRSIIPKTNAEIPWVLKIPAAVAVLTISGLDPQVLTQASVDWVNASLKSGDVAARKAAANIIGDLPKEKAKTLFAAAVATPDPDPEVRKALLKSGGNITKTPEVTKAIVAAATTEADPGVKEVGVKALGNTKDASAVEPLKTVFVPQGGRVAVFAAGALAELGDPDGKAGIEAALKDPKLKAAAIEAAVESENKDVISLLTPLSADRDVKVRFLAAESVAGYSPDSATVTTIQPVLEEGVKSKDLAVQARAVAALSKIGISAKGTLSIDDYLAAPEAIIRKSALPLIAAKGAKDGIRYARIVLEDQDPEIRAGVLPVLEQFVGAKRENLQPVVSMLKIALEDPNPGIRNKAQALIVKLAPDGAASKTKEAPKPLPEQPAEPVAPPANVCGDSVMKDAEECDDGNTANGDGCSDQCKKEAPVPAGTFLQKSIDSVALIDGATTEIANITKKIEDILAKEDPSDDKELKGLKEQLQDQNKIIVEQLKVITEAETEAKAAPDPKATDVVTTNDTIKGGRKTAKDAQDNAKKQLKLIDENVVDFDGEAKAIYNLIQTTKLEQAQKRLDKLAKLAGKDEVKLKKIRQLQDQIDAANQ